MPRSVARSPTTWPSALQQIREVPLAPKPEPDQIGIDTSIHPPPNLTPVYSRKVYNIKSEGVKDEVFNSPQQYYVTTTPQNRVPFEIVSVYNSGGLTSEASSQSDHDYGMSNFVPSSDALAYSSGTPITPSPSTNYARLAIRPAYATPGSEGTNHQPVSRLVPIGAKSTGAVKSRARRWLDLDNSVDGGEPAEGFKTPIKPASAIKRKLEISSSPSPNKVARSPAEKTRHETSLGLLTTKFVSLFHSDPNGTVDLNKASQNLQVQKRRIYDITNVLEGIGLVEKKSKNTVHWCGAKSQIQAPQQSSIDQLEEQEKMLDNLIQNTELQIKLLNQDKQYAYVSYQDLRNVPRFKNQTIIAIKAPPEAKLHVPHPSDGLQIYMSSETGEIEVFLCPEEETRSEEESEHELSPIKTRIMLSEAGTTSEADIHDDELKRILENSYGVGSGTVSGLSNSLVPGVSSHVGVSSTSTCPPAANDLFSGAGDVSVNDIAGIPLDPPLEDDYVLSLGDEELLPYYPWLDNLLLNVM